MPADDIKVHILENRFIDTRNIGQSTLDLDLGHNAILKGSDYKITVPLHEFKYSEVDAIMKRTEALWVAGNIQYTDGFGSKQKTDFAYVFDPVLPNGQWIPRPVKSFTELQKMK